MAGRAFSALTLVPPSCDAGAVLLHHFWEPPLQLEEEYGAAVALAFLVPAAAALKCSTGLRHPDAAWPTEKDASCPRRCSH
mmetsp:Transcript_70281/g.155030  ORF Transcript_70281/g.155030 Transcript_70281/m.155030 type:complete len:81 (+) Transcript_70281:383-625(+)